MFRSQPGKSDATGTIWNRLSELDYIYAHHRHDRLDVYSKREGEGGEVVDDSLCATSVHKSNCGEL